MTLWHWNLLAEILGFASALLLLWPSIALNRFLRDVETTLGAFRGAKTAFGKRVGEAAEPRLKEDRLPQWSEADQRKLQWGAALLALSFLVKMFVVWHSPG